VYRQFHPHLLPRSGSGAAASAAALRPGALYSVCQRVHALLITPSPDTRHTQVPQAPGYLLPLPEASRCRLVDPLFYDYTKAISMQTTAGGLLCNQLHLLSDRPEMKTK